MKDIKTLIQKLLTQKPYSSDSSKFLTDGSIQYKNGELDYDISIYKNEHNYVVSLQIGYNNDEDFVYDTYDSELNEREFMEIKWKIEEWEKVLHEDRLEAFADYVESLPGDARDELLND